jgi:hypothetical protein
VRACSDQEIKQLQSWKQTISSVIVRLQDLIHGQDGPDSSSNGMSSYHAGDPEVLHPFRPFRVCLFVCLF